VRCSLVALALSLTLVSLAAMPEGPGVRRAIHVKRSGPPDISALTDATMRPRFEPSAALDPVLGKWWRVVVPNGEEETALAALASDPEVESAYIEPVIAPASLDMGEASAACPVKTPSYSPYQVYLAEAPAGINVPAAWIRGARGQGVRFADIEGGWNQKHEDIPGDRMEHVAGQKLQDRGWEAHGTAVVGVVASKDNGIGMVGIAPDVERIYTASLARIGVAPAIERAQAKLQAGDVLLIELHGVGPRGRWLPMEFWDDIYDVIRVATSRGVIVVEAAGNGGEDLDHPAYGGKFDRTTRDSGAIMVGAGAPARGSYVDRSRLDFSNYGKRVDVQGWGYLVATLDYGDLQNCGAADRKYTNTFGGTSSASPVVAGAAILLQSAYAQATGKVLDPAAMRRILTVTGSPQTDGPHGPKTQHIGPRPDLQRALAELDRLAVVPVAKEPPRCCVCSMEDGGS
jgi:subtilisin family serine protease